MLALVKPLYLQLAQSSFTTISKSHSLQLAFGHPFQPLLLSCDPHEITTMATVCI